MVNWVDCTICPFCRLDKIDGLNHFFRCPFSLDSIVKIEEDKNIRISKIITDRILDRSKINNFNLLRLLANNNVIQSYIN